jgi:hypothetical protein
VAAPDTQSQSEHPLRRHRRHQYRGRCPVILEVSLNHEAAQGMADEHRLATQFLGGGPDIVEVVGDGHFAHRLRRGAGAVPAQAERDRAIARSCEEVQEVVLPTPCAMPAAVHEKQRHRMRVTAGPLVDHLEHEPDPLAATIPENSLWPSRCARLPGGAPRTTTRLAGCLNRCLTG